VVALLVVVTGVLLAVAPLLPWHELTLMGESVSRTGFGTTSYDGMSSTEGNDEGWIVDPVPDGALVTLAGGVAVLIGLGLALQSRIERTALPAVLVVVGLVALAWTGASFFSFKHEFDEQMSDAREEAREQAGSSPFGEAFVDEMFPDLDVGPGGGMILAGVSALILVLLGVVAASGAGAARRSYARRLTAGPTAAGWHPPGDVAGGVTPLGHPVAPPPMGFGPPRPGSTDQQSGSWK
jgi:hypothetical protein